MIDANRVIQSVVKSGRAFYGSNQAIKAIKSGRIVALILSSNCPTESRKKLEKYATQSSVPVINYAGTGRDLGIACRKPFSVSILAVREISESDLALEIQELNKPVGG
jgi:large subunit ribosomal protein L30e